MQEVKRHLRSGYILNEYRIEKPIGGGGFSLVYLAYHIATKAKVVIKEYCPEDQCQRLPGSRVMPLSEDKLPLYRMGIKYFFDEASALAKVNHPNIVRVSNIFRDNNTVYMVMDYDEGTDLRWHIKRHPTMFSEKFLRTVFPQLLLGLRELHNQGLLHLDIKPSNILLRSHCRPLLLDFGAVQHYMIGSQTSWNPTRTPCFAPIEQHEKGNLGPWTDIYAIGASMYSCISGKPPPPAPERVENDRLLPFGKNLARRYSKQILQAIDWALQIQAGDRPQSVDEYLDSCWRQEVQLLAERAAASRRQGLRLPRSKGRSPL